MERSDRAAVVSLFWGEPFAVGEVRLRGSPAHHARARRIRHGDPLRLVDGHGHVAHGAVLTIGSDDVMVALERVVEVPRPTPLEVIVPVADRDRMLLAAEKCVELQVTAWRPAYFARSRSVSPRGDGDKFREKLKSRMQSALEQSGSAWMPDIHEEAEAIDALESIARDWKRFLLDATGAPLAPFVWNGPTALAVGPEGGTERHEIAAAEKSGWGIASLGATTLRFETAVIAGAAVIRAAQMSLRSA